MKNNNSNNIEPTHFLKTKEEIVKWLKKYRVRNYTLLPNKEYGWVVDVEGHVNLQKNKLNTIPVKFNIVNGDFDCSYNKLSSLNGSPHTVNGSFYCVINKLITLEYAPNKISGNFTCFENNLTTLKGCPKEISGNFSCADNQLTTLQYAPTFVDGNVLINNNNLISLKHFPKTGSFKDVDISKNNLISLKYLPEKVTSLNCSHNKLKNLKFVSKHINEFFDCRHNQIKSYYYFPEYVGFSKLSGYEYKDLTQEEVEKIVSKDRIIQEKKTLDKHIKIKSLKSKLVNKI